MAVTVDLAGTVWTVPEGWELRGAEHPAECRSCHAPILWLRHRVSHKPAPFDQDGTSHFATCPQAGQWRRRP